MSDDDLIRRGDAVLAVTAADKECLGANGARDFIRAVPAVQVGVKPMEWLEIRHGQYFEARVIGILYSVRLGTDGISRWQAGHMGTWRDAPTIEAAKAAAQADYAAHIRSTLTVTPAPDAGKVQALVEALDRLIALNDDYSPFGGELFQDRVDRTWRSARATLAKIKGADHE